MRVILLSSILLWSGCIFSSSSEGTVELRWTIGAGVQTCAEAGLDSVEITLEESEGAILGPYTTVCEAGRGDLFVIDGVDEGTYTVSIDGFTEGDLVYSGRSEQSYTVVADRTIRTETIVLSPIPASLQVLWRFQDGRQCGFHDVDEMIVRAFLNNSIAEQVTTLCSEGEAILEEVLPGTYDIQVTALDALTQDAVFRFIEPNIIVTPGTRTPVDGILEPCSEIEGGCL
jgi:hypothetical protein